MFGIVDLAFEIAQQSSCPHMVLFLLGGSDGPNFSHLSTSFRKSRDFAHFGHKLKEVSRCHERIRFEAPKDDLGFI